MGISPRQISGAWWRPFMRLLGPAMTAAAVLLCAAVSLMPRPALLVGDETNSPSEQEEQERESHEESLEFHAGIQTRQRLKSDCCLCWHRSAAGNQSSAPRRQRETGYDGHCLANGQPAPLVC